MKNITGIWEHDKYKLSDFFRRFERQHPDPDRTAEKVIRAELPELEEMAKLAERLEKDFKEQFPDGDSAA